METDENPSVVCALFCTQKGYKNFLKEIDGCNGMRVREIRLVDIGIPLDKNFNSNVNKLKSGSMPILSSYLDMIPFASTIWKTIYNKRKFQKFDYSKKWETDTANPFIYSGLTPIMVDMKGLDNPNFTDEEKEKLNRLVSFDTPDYKPDRSNISKNQKDTKEIPKRWTE